MIVASAKVVKAPFMMWLYIIESSTPKVINWHSKQKFIPVWDGSSKLVFCLHMV